MFAKTVCVCVCVCVCAICACKYQLRVCSSEDSSHTHTNSRLDLQITCQFSEILAKIQDYGGLPDNGEQWIDKTSGKSYIRLHAKVVTYQVAL